MCLYPALAMFQIEGANYKTLIKQPKVLKTTYTRKGLETTVYAQ